MILAHLQKEKEVAWAKLVHVCHIHLRLQVAFRGCLHGARKILALGRS